MNFYIAFAYIRIQHHSFACGYPVVPTSFVGKTVVSPLDGFCTIVGNQLTVSRCTDSFLGSQFHLIYRSILLPWIHLILEHFITFVFLLKNVDIQENI